MFIYLITNTKNGKVYVGQTIYKNPNNRWSAHKTELKANRCHNLYLQRAWNKYGIEVWSYKIIDKAKSINELNQLEKYYIDEVFDSRNPANGYNIRKGGNNSPLSEETKAKISKARTKFFNSSRGDKTRKILSRKASQQERTKKSNIKRSKTLRRYRDEYPIIVSPNGKEYKIDTVRGFCNEHKIYGQGVAHFRRVVNGQKIQYKGWHLKTTNHKKLKKALAISNRQNVKDRPSILSPDGIVYEVKGTLQEFCNQHGLGSAGKLSNLLTGKRNTYKGWTLA